MCVCVCVCVCVSEVMYLSIADYGNYICKVPNSLLVSSPKFSNTYNDQSVKIITDGGSKSNEAEVKNSIK